jgi:hypothetical protein
VSYRDWLTSALLWVIGGALLLFAAFWIVRVAIVFVAATRGLLLVAPLLTWGAFAVGWAPVGWVLVIATGVVLGGLVLSGLGVGWVPRNAITPGRLAYEAAQRQYWAAVANGGRRRPGDEEPWEKIGAASRRGWESIALSMPPR